MRRLIADAQIASNIPHQGEKGSARESGIGRFLSLYLPDGWDICSGFIADSFGNTSQQTDLIIYNKRILPARFYDGAKAYVPIEAVLYAGEVKSVSSRTELNNAVQKMRRVRGLKDRQHISRVIPFYFAYSTDLKGKSELDRLYELAPQSDRDPPIYTMCIINHGYWAYHWEKLPGGEKIKTGWIHFPSFSGNDYLAGFVLGLLNTIARENSTFRSAPSLGNYVIAKENPGSLEREITHEK